MIKTELRPRLLLGSQRPQRVGWSAKPWAAAAWRHQVRADEARAAGFSWEIRRLRTFVEAAGAWRYSSARDVPAGLSAKEVSLACIVWLASAAISATSPRGAVFQEGKDRFERSARMRCELNSSCVCWLSQRLWQACVVCMDFEILCLLRSLQILDITIPRSNSIQQCRVQLLVARKFMSCSSAACPQTTRGPVGNEKNR